MRPEIANGVSKALQLIAPKLTEDAKEFCPKDTTKLAESIQVMELDDNHLVIGTENEYAVYVEFGTSAMVIAHGEHDYKNPVTNWEAKRKRNDSSPSTMPYLSRALYNNLRFIIETIGRCIQNELDR